VLAVVDAGVDPAVLIPPVPAAPVAEADVDVVDAAPKIDPEAAVADVVWDERARDGDPNEKPTLPALGGVDPSLLPGATPNPNEAGVVDDVDVPKVNGDGFAGEPNGPPNMLLGGG
jgi:hypothetical protein